MTAGATPRITPPFTPSTLSPLAPPKRVTSAADVLVIALQLAVATYLVWFFRIEGTAFAEKIVPLAALGFLPHHFAPARWRMPIFIALSFIGIWSVFGMLSIWLVALVGLFVATCHLPIRFPLRVALLLGMGAVLAMMRLDKLASPIPGAIWPIVASILMFRLAGYLYDLKTRPQPPGVAATLAYFFMLPNVTFTLFPVVDFATFKRTYYDRAPGEIYSEGVQWILRGAFQLVLYRAIYQYAVIPVSDVTNTASLVRYLLANFGLYLRVSGSFHLAIGLLHLYGFRLPETHRLFYLSSSFTDFWRRINIYWKDYMQKLVFNPTYYPLRRIVGDTHALTLATLAVFATTCVLHAYQWLWILGRWQFSVTDTLFWGILAVVLVVNSQWEARRGRTRTVTRNAVKAGGARDALLLGLKTAATFAVICTLWGLWTSPTLSEFVGIMKVVRFGATDIGIIAGVLAAIGIIAVLFDRLLPRYLKSTEKLPGMRFAVALAPIAILGFISQPPVAGAIGAPTHRMARALRSNTLNRADADELQRGYYEELTQVRKNNGELWRVYAERPHEWGTIDSAGARRDTKTFIMRELVPGAKAAFFKGAPISINADGMRDKLYPVAKPPGTWRIAVIGKSHVLGEGVPDDSTFEAMLERHLEETRPAGAPRVEILNFAVSGFTPLQQAALMDGDRVKRYSPDVVLYVGHTTDVDAMNHLAQVVGDSLDIPYDTLRKIADVSGVRAQPTYALRRRALMPYKNDLFTWAYRHAAEGIRAIGAIPAWVYVPLPVDQQETSPAVISAAKRAGFQVLDVPEMYIGYDETALVLGSWDNHPNIKGHHVIAARLFDALQENPALLGRGAARAP